MCGTHFSATSYSRTGDDSYCTSYVGVRSDAVDQEMLRDFNGGALRLCNCVGSGDKGG
jgi:hypothetical protein